MKLNKFFLFMLILIYSLINISGNNSPIGIGESSNDSKRALEEQIDNYIILQFNKDVTYEGKWKNDRQEGIGTESWKDGTTYTGEFKNGQIGRAHV